MKDRLYSDKQRSLKDLQPWPTFKNGPWLKPAVAKSEGQLKASIKSVVYTEKENAAVEITVKNTQDIPLFMTQIELYGIDSPCYTNDNFFWLPPGEEKLVRLTIKGGGASIIKGKIKVSAWNAKAEFLPIKNIQRDQW